MQYIGVEKHKLYFFTLFFSNYVMNTTYTLRLLQQQFLHNNLYK